MKEALSFFYPFDTNINFSELEKEVINYWDQMNTFKKSVDQRPLSKSYVFYDGPPFATGLPHYGHILTSVIKDLIPRFYTMHGYRVERRLGWDCHGVPAEFETEKQLNLNGKEDIERLGMDKFNEACRAIVLRYATEWKTLLKRIGRWVDFENDYKTMDPDYMETIWWIFKSLWEKNLIYEDYKVVHYSWRLSTPYSNFEATLDDAYRERQDPAVVAKFKLDNDASYILAWTTTPWTLPSNMALAVGEKIRYCKVETKEDDRPVTYILAKQLVTEWFAEKNYAIVDEFDGAQLVGETYIPLFDYFTPLKNEGAFKIIPADFVSIDEGTGVVHIAPAFGEDDFYTAKLNNIPLVNPVDDLGRFTNEVEDFKNLNVFDANPLIVKKLQAESKLFVHYSITHQYPHDWRTDTPLIYRAIPSWYVNVTQIKDMMIDNNKEIFWMPTYLKHGAFENWLRNARDWAISRNRYWGTPIPVWKCNNCDHVLVIGSIDELENLSGIENIHDIHRHYIDQIAIRCSECGGVMNRVSEVLDCWFESGGMPYGQVHYPFEKKEWFDENFPADFIVEYTGQLRGWFYTLIILSTALFDKPPFKNVIVHGVTLGEDGRKMSKRLRNYPDPDEMLNEFGADTMRMYLLDHPIIYAQDSRIERKGIIETFRKFTNPLWNAFSFLVRYADIDDWRPSDEKSGFSTLLDKWILSRIYDLSYQVSDSITSYDIRNAASLLISFVDDLTNWYIRRSRERFWKHQRDEVKTSAYETLHEVLVIYCKILAPFVPFISEVIYKNLTGEESVHLDVWPKPNRNLIDHELIKSMATVRQIASLGLSARAKAQIKVRQPLAKVRIHTDTALKEADLSLIADELNVKSVELLDDVSKYADIMVVPDASIIGPNYGSDTQDIIRAARMGDFTILDDGSVVIAKNDEWVFSGDSINIYYQGKPGYACEVKDDIVVVLDTHMTEALLLEGIIRELVRHIQSLRKEANLNLDDRIDICVVSTSKNVSRAMSEFKNYLTRETLADNVKAEFKEDWVHTKKINISGDDVNIAVRKKDNPSM